jgi:hypothetical protein
MSAAFTVTRFESWWYALPVESRSPRLYTAGTIVASAIYPAFVALVFWQWCRPLGRTGSVYPRRTVVAGIVAVVLSATYYVSQWSYGLEYQGLGFMIACLSASAMFLGTIAIAWYRYRPTGAWLPGLVLHWMLFAWICFLAFPWLGEMI